MEAHFNPVHEVEKQLVAMGVSRFDVATRVLKKAPAIHEELFINQAKDLVPQFVKLNEAGQYVLVRPHGEHGLSLLSGLNNRQIAEMGVTGFEPALVLQYGHDDYQVWLKHDRKLNDIQSEKVTHQLAKFLGADTDAAHWNSFGFLAGFLSHHDAKGQPQSPYQIKIVDASGREYSEAGRFIDRLLESGD